MLCERVKNVFGKEKTNISMKCPFYFVKKTLLKMNIAQMSRKYIHIFASLSNITACHENVHETVGQKYKCFGELMRTEICKLAFLECFTPFKLRKRESIAYNLQVIQ